MFRKIRIAVLLLILLAVALNTWTDSIITTSWNAPMTVALYPIAADESEVTQRFLASLKQTDFDPLENFFQAESAEYGVQVERPLRFTLAPILKSQPPQRPESRNILSVMWWSLRLRWWSWREVPKAPGPTPRIRMFLIYNDPGKVTVLNHSTALKKGLLGLAYLFADTREQGSNLTVIAHELLHTVGATDKYDPGTGQPAVPDGLAEPDKTPLYPQRYAELMGGRIATSSTRAEIPKSLSQVLVGPATAAEIGWLKKQ